MNTDLSFTGLGHRLISFHKASIANVIIESLDEIHSCLLRILMWNYRSKVNYLCVKLRVHFRAFRKKLQEVVLAVLSGPSDELITHTNDVTVTIYVNIN